MELLGWLLFLFGLQKKTTLRINYMMQQVHLLRFSRSDRRDKFSTIKNSKIVYNMHSPELESSIYR